MPFQMTKLTSSGNGQLAVWVGSRTFSNFLSPRSKISVEIGGNVEWMVAAMDFKAVNQATNMNTSRSGGSYAPPTPSSTPSTRPKFVFKLIPTRPLRVVTRPEVPTIPGVWSFPLPSSGRMPCFQNGGSTSWPWWMMMTTPMSSSYRMSSCCSPQKAIL